MRIYFRSVSECLGLLSLGANVLMCGDPPVEPDSFLPPPFPMHAAFVLLCIACCILKMFCSVLILFFSLASPFGYIDSSRRSHCYSNDLGLLTTLACLPAYCPGIIPTTPCCCTPPLPLSVPFLLVRFHPRSHSEPAPATLGRRPRCNTPLLFLLPFLGSLCLTLHPRLPK